MVLVRKGSPGNASSTATSTVLPEVNAHQVTQAEFMDLAAAVIERKEE